MFPNGLWEFLSPVHYAVIVHHGLDLELFTNWFAASATNFALTISLRKVRLCHAGLGKKYIALSIFISGTECPVIHVHLPWKCYKGL